MVSEHQSSRRVGLVVVSYQHAPEELADRLSTPRESAAQARARLHTPATGQITSEASWEIYEEGTSGSDISEQLDGLYAQIKPITTAIKELRAEGCKIILRIILYLSSSDNQGAGFVISGDWLKWMNEVGVEFVDVDQYILE